MDPVAALTNLENNETADACSVLGVDGRTMRLKLPRHINIGSAVKVEGCDTLSLGEVSYCHPEGEGYVVWVELLQALHHVNELSRLARALLAEG